MHDKNTFEYYEFEVGRYLPFDERDQDGFKPYEEDNKHLVWNIIWEDNNRFDVINILQHPYMVGVLLSAKKQFKDDYIKFADFIRRRIQYNYWSRCEYELILTTWPLPHLGKEDINKLVNEYNREEKRHKENGYNWEPYIETPLKEGKKIDVYTQIMINWDRFIQYIWNNKNLITPKKLGLK